MSRSPSSKEEIRHVENYALHREPTVISTHDYVNSYPITAHTAHYRNAPRPPMGNPSPIGLFAFSLTTFVLSFYNAGIGKVAVPNIVVGLAVFYGGLAQFVAGILELFAGNTFAAQAFISYGAFWLSYAAISIPWFGIVDAFKEADGAGTLETGVGIYLSAVRPSDIESLVNQYADIWRWAIYTLIVLLACLRTNIAFVALIAVLEVTFWFLAAGAYTGHETLTHVGGYLGIVVGALGWYNAAASIITVESSGWALPIGLLSRPAHTHEDRV